MGKRSLNEQHDYEFDKESMNLSYTWNIFDYEHLHLEFSDCFGDIYRKKGSFEVTLSVPANHPLKENPDLEKRISMLPSRDFFNALESEEGKKFVEDYHKYLENK